MISKELFSEVLGHGFCAITELTQSVDGKYISWSTYEEPRPHDWKQINIHELAHRCKEWALGKGCVLKSTEFQRDSSCEVTHPYGKDSFYGNYKDFQASTESEAILSACEWIFNETTIRV